jgi:plastocyanin
MTPRSLFVLVPAAAVAAALAVPVTAAAVRAPDRAGAKDAAVSVQNFAFSPATAKIGLGNTVTWTFRDPVAHTATDSSGMALWNSGAHANGTTFVFSFAAAGTYAYICSIHPTTMKGSVSVPMKFKPKKGGVGTSFTITWASAAAPAGFVFDVQLKRPGAAAFTTWQNGVTTLSATFHPDAGTGSYQFQARLRKSSSGAASGFSAAKGIKVS